MTKANKMTTQTLTQQNLVSRVLHDGDPSQKLTRLSKNQSPDKLECPKLRGFKCLHSEGLFFGECGVVRRVYHISGATIILEKSFAYDCPKPPIVNEVLASTTEAGIYSENKDSVESASQILKQNGYQEYRNPRT